MRILRVPPNSLTLQCEFRINIKIMKLQKLKDWLAGLSFRVGIGVALACILCYAISFAQMLLPISVGAKGALWVIFFGLAKTFQYSAILIFGKEGIAALRQRFSRRKA